jgi:Patatin-like phospholipase
MATYANMENSVTAPTWRNQLTPCNAGGIVLFEEEFLQQWGNQPWPPRDDPASADDISAASKMHVQLVSRITTQRLPYADGVEAAALKSVYQLFGEARDIFKAHSKCRLTDAISWYVLNTHVRPFTAKWHRQSERGALTALDATDIFRDELNVLQQRLTRFDALLVKIRDGDEPPPAPKTGESVRERDIRTEMDLVVPWGIDRILGGLPETTADAINAEERAAVTARRLYYRPRSTGRPAAAGPANPPPAAAGDAMQPPKDLEKPPPAQPPAEPPEREAWRNRQHAVALAISGGGIRSATFALGVLVALARRNLLYQFDYLSTVSGGGYLGAFLTTFLNAETAACQTPQIGLRRDQLPFRRDDGEAAALRHVRHHSKYLATGRLWERLQMAFAQVYGMALNGLGFAYLAILVALAEHVIRQMILPPGSFWPVPILVVAFALMLISFLIPLVMRWLPGIRKFADAMLAWPFLALFALLGWQGLENSHGYYVQAVGQGWGPWLIGVAAIPLIASALLALAGNLPLPIRLVLVILSAIAAPLLFFGIELAAYQVVGGRITLPLIGAADGASVALIVAVAGFLLFWVCFDINFTAPHRHYKKKLGQAYLIQPNPRDAARPKEDVSLLLSRCIDKGRAPYHLINCALNVPASENPAMQGRLTDFFLFSPAFCGSPLTGYRPTLDWEKLDTGLDLGTAMAISGAAAAPQMGTGTMRNFSFWLALFNVRLGYWVRNPGIDGCRGSPPGLSYLLQEMFGWAKETRSYVNVSDGGHIENLGVYELLRRRCRYIVAIDGEQDPKMTFHGLATLQRLAAIDLGVTIEIGVDELRLGEKGLSRSHFTFCRINYPNGSRDGIPSHGYLIYVKLSLTGNEGEFIRRYRLDEPDFPHHSTADQFFTETQFEAYRSLGEHVGDKMFLSAIVGPDIATSNDVDLEQWFLAIGKNLLDPLAKK